MLYVNPLCDIFISSQPNGGHMHFDEEFDYFYIEDTSREEAFKSLLNNLEGQKIDLARLTTDLEKIRQSKALPKR